MTKLDLLLAVELLAIMTETSKLYMDIANVKIIEIILEESKIVVSRYCLGDPITCVF